MTSNHLIVLAFLSLNNRNIMFNKIAIKCVFFFFCYKIPSFAFETKAEKINFTHFQLELNILTL